MRPSARKTRQLGLHWERELSIDLDQIPANSKYLLRHGLFELGTSCRRPRPGFGRASASWQSLETRPWTHDAFVLAENHAELDRSLLVLLRQKVARLGFVAGVPSTCGLGEAMDGDLSRERDRADPLRDYCLGLLMPGERKSVEPELPRSPRIPAARLSRTSSDRLPAPILSMTP